MTSFDAAALNQLKSLVDEAKTILILQPDSPDGDSCWTALGLEEILGDLGKNAVMFSYKEPEPYLRTYDGWDRIAQDMPRDFDMTILVDTGSPALIKSTLQHHSVALTSRPIVVIDHHATRSDFGFKTIDIVSDAVATAEQVAAIAIQLGWPVNEQAANKLVAAIVSDSLNLTTSGTTVHTIQMVAYLMERGASLYEISRLRRETSALDEGQVHLKGQLLSSTRFEAGGRLAIAEIPPDVVASQKNRFEPYNMIISDMQWASGVEVAAVFKNYGTKINVPLRSKNGLAGKLAEAMGGGGHANAGAYRCDSTDIAHEIDKLITQFEQVVKDHDALS